MQLNEHFKKKYQFILTSDFQLEFPLGWLDLICEMLDEMIKAYKKRKSILFLRKNCEIQIKKIYTKHGILRVDFTEINPELYEILKKYAERTTEHCSLCSKPVNQIMMNKTSAIFLCDEHRATQIETGENENEKVKVHGTSTYSIIHGSM